MGFKLAWTRDPKPPKPLWRRALRGIADVVTAFANAAGGLLPGGVTDDGLVSGHPRQSNGLRRLHIQYALGVKSCAVEPFDGYAHRRPPICAPNARVGYRPRQPFALRSAQH